MGRFRRRRHPVLCSRCREEIEAEAPPRPRVEFRATGSLTSASIEVSALDEEGLSRAFDALTAIGASTDGLTARLEGAAAVRFWTLEAARLAEVFDVYAEDGVVEDGVRPDSVGVHVLVTGGSEWIGAQASLEAGGVQLDQADLVEAVTQGRDVVQLEDGTWAKLSSPEAARSIVSGELAKATGKGMKLAHRDVEQLEGVLRGLGKVKMVPGTERLFQALLVGAGGIVPRKLQAGLRPYQEAGLAWLRFIHDLGAGGVLADQMGLGKMEMKSNDIPTPTGWRKFGDLRVGDLVFGRDGKPTRVTGVFPQGNQPVFKVTCTDGASVTVGAEHLWRVQSANQKFTGHPGHVLTTAEILRRGLKDAAGTRKWFIPICDPVSYETKCFPADPYLIGALIANGSTCHSLAHTGGEDQRAIIEPMLPPGCSFGKLVKHTRTIRSDTGENKLRVILRDLGMWGLIHHQKRIPRQYLLGDVDQRLAMLQGLMDNDGTVDARTGTVEYNTVSPGLADDVMEIIRSLGGSAWMSTRIPKYEYKGKKLEGRTDHRIRMSLPNGIVPFRLPRKVERYKPRTKYQPTHAIESIEPAGEAECVCISVEADDHLYLTKDYIVTHNTLQTIALLCSVQEDEGHVKALIVAPTSVVPNWMKELSKFAPHLRVLRWQGPSRMEKLASVASQAEVIVTSYGLARNDIEFFNGMGLSYIILDEAQYIKTPSNATSQAMRKMNATHRLAITGTPIENRLSEFWSLFDFTSPGLLGTLAQFKANARLIGEGDKDAVAKLRQQIGPFLLRRETREVAKDLPDRIEQDYLCPMTEKQASLYEELKRNARAKVAEAGASPSTVLQLITRLRQVACDPRLADSVGGMKEEDSGKILALRDLLEECIDGGHRVILFSQFTSMLTLIQQMLKKNNIRYEYLDGQVRDRMGCVDRFQADVNIPVFLISLKAGGTGLNITAADTVIHYDPWWNPAVEDQATARAHRIGQTRTVTVYRLIAEGSIEEKVSEMKSRKAKLAADVLADAESFERSVTLEDMRGLLD
jgi:hypothetical protein